MLAVILAGGKGTRLAPYNTIFPKPLVPLGEKPILDIIIRQLIHYGFDEIVISVGYLAELIEAYITSQRKSYSGAQIRFLREDMPLGTVGSLSLLNGMTESFLVINGDILSSIRLDEMFAFHCAADSMMTIATYNRQIPLELGLMDVSSEGKLQSFREKPTLEYPVSMGIYAYRPEILDYIPSNSYFDVPHLIWKLLEIRQDISCYRTDEYWLDLGSHLDYAKALEEYEEIKTRILPWDTCESITEKSDSSCTS